MPDLKNFEQITDITFDHEGAHLALTHRSQGYSANNRPDPLIIKSNTEITDEAKEALDLIKQKKYSSSGNSGGKNRRKKKNSDDNKPEDVNKSTGENMPDNVDKVEIEKAQLDSLLALQKTVEDLQKANEEKDKKVEDLEKAAYQATLKEKVGIVKSLGFVSEDEDQVTLATALIKIASIDGEASKTIENVLEKARVAMSELDKELGHDFEGEIPTHTEAVTKSVRNFLNLDESK